MPNFTEYGVEVDVDLDISVNEFLSECSSTDIKEMIGALIEDGHLTGLSLIENNTISNNEGDFISKLRDLSSKYYSMSNEDIVQIEELHKKYC